MKKILLIFSFCLMMLSCSFKQNNSILFLGNDLHNIEFVTYLKEEQNFNINDDFLMKNGYISYLYTFVVQNAETNNTSIKSSIKKSNKIFINIGYNDILRSLLKTDNDEYYINEEILKNQQELFSYYFFLTIEEIRDIYSKDIIILSPYVNDYKNYDEKIVLEKALDQFYLVYEEVAEYFSCSLIDLRDVSLLKNKDKKIICDYVYQKVNYGS